MRGLILSLCDHSGSWSLPYLEAGYDVMRVDLKDGHDVRLIGFIDQPVHGIIGVPLMPRAKKPPAKKFTAHQITLDPETARYARSIIGTAPEINSLSAVLRHVLRYHKAWELETKKQEKCR